MFTYYWSGYLYRHPSKAVYVTGVIVLVAGWIFFHYTGIAADIVHLVAPSVKRESVRHSLLFPLGMSFYTFQAIGYMTDVYWGEEKAERKLPDFLLYMLFFMKFLSGPIERPAAMFRQLENPQGYEYAHAVRGMEIILLGLMKKLLIANTLSPYTAAMFGSVHELSGVQALMTCMLYPLELYADFSGYTDIAIGGAYMFGIRLSPNFDRPFISTSTSELWRRWHMSLSFWVRDYLFMPISMATRQWRSFGTYFSLLSTFLLLGLWHGLGCSFAVYGLIQGIVICFETRFTYIRNHLHRWVGSGVATSLLILRTYILFAVSLLFFRLPSVADAAYLLSHISLGVHSTWKEMNIGIPDHNAIVAGAALLLMWLYEYFNSKTDLWEALSRRSAWQRWCVYYSLVIALFVVGEFGNESFIYLQF